MKVRDYIVALQALDPELPCATMGSDEDWYVSSGPYVQTRMHDCNGFYLHCAGKLCGLCKGPTPKPLVNLVQLQ